jgi:LPS export ABC transporter protein LptC
MAKGRRILAVGVIAAVVAVGLYSWLNQDWNQTLQPSAEDTAEADLSETDLVLRDVTLEQPDDNGQLLWRVRGTEVTYSPNQQVAYVTQPDGELFQDGEMIYVVTADTGEIRENGNVILLRGNIKATGLKNDSILRATN